jgi:hypothetical protein
MAGGHEDVAYTSFACPLVFEDQAPSKEEFISVLKQCTRLEGVFMNACDTGDYAELINKKLPYVAVVAWPGKPSDHEAYKFAMFFYHELGKQFGRSFEEAFDEALIAYQDFWNCEWSKQVLKETRMVSGRKTDLIKPILKRRHGDAPTVKSPKIVPALSPIHTRAAQQQAISPLASTSSNPLLSSPKPVKGLLGEQLNSVSRTSSRSQSAPVPEHGPDLGRPEPLFI